MTSTPVTRGDAVAVLLDLHRRTSGSDDVQAVFDGVLAAVTAELGWGAAVLNVREGDLLHVVAVAGPEDAVATLSGTSRPLAEWQRIFASARPLGLLRTVHHEDRGHPLEGLPDVWVPPVSGVDHPEAWHPMDSLFALLHDSAGELLGVLAVDLPDDGLRPDAARADLLQLFAVHTSAAIERARLTRRLTTREAAFRSVVRDAPVGMALFDDDARFCEVNDAFGEFLGRSPDELLGRTIAAFTHPDDLATGAELSAAVRRSGEPQRHELRHVHASGATVWGRVSLSRLDEPDGRVRVLAQVEDVTERRAAEQELLFRADHDELTGLPRRAVLLRGLAEALDDDDGLSAVLFLDVDHFKLVNDSLGHAAGDQLLVHVARTLVAAAGEEHLVGRLSGDEFVVVLRGLEAAYDAIGVAGRLRAAVGAPVSIAGRVLAPSISTGIALGGPGSDPGQLLANADAALYRAKAQGRGRWAVYDARMRAEAVAQLTVRSELAGALARGEFRLHYQPIVAMGSGATLGYEALLRWQHPTRGLLCPDAFLRLLEDSEAEDRVAHWVLDQACADASAWAPVGGVPPFVSVNVPPGQLSRPEFGRRVTAALRRHGLAPDQLWIEITEDRLVADDQQVMDLQRLRAEGIHVAIDDFGTGYAGLAYLQRLPADVVKLDKLFVQRVTDDPASATIVRSVVELSRLLGLRVVGEGIETPEQAEALTRLGVSLGQGYLYGRPRAVPPAVGAVRARATQLTAGSPAEHLDRLARGAAQETDPGELGRLFLAEARELTGASAGSMVVPHGDGLLRTVLADGYPPEVVAQFQVFPLSAPLPLSTAVSTGEPVYAEHYETLEPLHPALPRTSRTVATLAALPLVEGDQLLGGLGVSWDEPVVLTESVRGVLEDLAAVVTARLAQLRADLPTLPTPRSEVEQAVG